METNIEPKQQRWTLAKVDPNVLLTRYMNGESGVDIARSFGVTRQALSLYMLRHAEDQWRDVQVAKALTRLEQAEDAMEGAPDMLALSRAREQARSAQWQLERLCRRIYGQDVPQSVAAVQVNINLRRESATNAAQHKVIEADVSKSST